MRWEFSDGDPEGMIMPRAAGKLNGKVVRGFPQAQEN